jgi:hypothetical protein
MKQFLKQKHPPIFFTNFRIIIFNIWRLKKPKKHILHHFDPQEKKKKHYLVEISQENKKHWNLPQQIFNFYVICEQNGHSARLVEGFKRDWIVVCE